MRLVLWLACLAASVLVLLSAAASGLHCDDEAADTCAAEECLCVCHAASDLASPDAVDRPPAAGSAPLPGADPLGAGVLLTTDIFRPPAVA